MASRMKLLTWLSVGSSSLPGGLFCFFRGLAFIPLLARKERILSATVRFLLSKQHFVTPWSGSLSSPAACATLCLDKPETRAVTTEISQKDGREHVPL